MRYRVACELARERIAALAGRAVAAKGSSSRRSPPCVRCPFRVVFACGMGEGQFPSPDAEDPLDLRWARRREGDVTARERDKYAFLELLLGARDRLYLSYVSREPLTGEALAPSSVVEELLHAIERGYAVRRRVPAPPPSAAAVVAGVLSGALRAAGLRAGERRDDARRRGAGGGADAGAAHRPRSQRRPRSRPRTSSPAAETDPAWAQLRRPPGARPPPRAAARDRRPPESCPCSRS